MNIKDAYRLCPQGVFRHPDFEKYRAVSRQLHGIWDSYATASESVALDEAYLDITRRAVDLEGARRIARAIKERTRSELGLTCSVGVAYSKAAAKIASEEKKPDGYFEIPTPEAFVDLILDRDVRILYTVGEMTAEKLRTAGIRTVRELRDRREDVVRLLGKQGQWLTRLAFGEDDRKVTPYRPQDAKSIGREVTFQKDVSDWGLLRDVLVLLAMSVERRARRVGLAGMGVSLKLTYSDMRSITRSRITFSTSSAVTIWREAAEMLDGVEKRPVRLIGTGLYSLGPEEGRQLHFGELEAAVREREAEQARLLSELGERYGLDFAGHLEEIFRGETLYRTIEYMRKHGRSGGT